MNEDPNYLEYCELCTKKVWCHMVVLDENMETYMCPDCIEVAQQAMDVEIICED